MKSMKPSKKTISRDQESKDSSQQLPVLSLKTENWVLAELGAVDLLISNLKDSKSVNKDMGWGRTLLHVASLANQPEVVASLLQLKANPQQRDQEGFTPVDLALQNYSHQVIEIFKEAGHFKRKPQPRLEPFKNIFDAAEQGDFVYIMNHRQLWDNKGAWMRNPLHWAAIYGHHQIYNLLINKGAVVRKDGMGMLPIHYVKVMQFNPIRLNLNLPLVKLKFQ